MPRQYNPCPAGASPLPSGVRGLNVTDTNGKQAAWRYESRSPDRAGDGGQTSWLCGVAQNRQQTHPAPGYSRPAPGKDDQSFGEVQKMARPARNPVQPHAWIVQQAVRKAGSQQRLADAINRRIREERLGLRPVVQQTVSHWIRRNKKIPDPYLRLIQRIVTGPASPTAVCRDRSGNPQL